MRSLIFEDDVVRFAHSAWQSLKLDPPADLDRVASRLGVDVYREEFSQEIDGFYLWIPGASPVVAINSCYLKPPARQRFTLAHELGHHLLAERNSAGVELFFIDGLKTSRSILERSCDQFAALLLMPEDRVREWFKELASNRENRTAILAERFGVSLSAIRVRLRELGLPYRKWEKG